MWPEASSTPRVLQRVAWAQFPWPVCAVFQCKVDHSNHRISYPCLSTTIMSTTSVQAKLIKFLEILLGRNSEPLSKTDIVIL